MKRPQKKYKSETEIIKLIDSNRAKLDGIPQEIEDALTFAKSLAKWLNDNPHPKNDRQRGVHGQIWHWEKKFVEDAEKFRRSVPRLQRKAEILKQKLSAFRTMTLPGVVNDDSVV